jgi:TRAP transporter 4TM/12TM fusion protein
LAFRELSFQSISVLTLATSIFGKFRGGPAKVAVVGSALMGTISGSAVANVAGTGCITIPLMKKTGYDSKSAAAIEAVASSGGLIMPPIMGAAAFVMSEFLGVPYLKIIVAAIIPALLYYIAVFVAVDCKAARMGLVGMPKEELPNFKEVIKSGFKFIIPLLILTYLIVVVMSSPQKAAFWGIISIIVIHAFELIKNKKYGELKGIFDIFEEGSKQGLSIIVACACAGIVVGVISLTGVGFMLSGALVEIGGQNLFLLLFITMCTSIVLGMGLPVTACYIILAVLAAPALVNLGVNPIAAHLFVMYFGVLSGITPPVALAAYVGAGIAEAKPMAVSIEACKIGIVAFILHSIKINSGIQ